MSYKEISEKTFGCTPAAMYLARELNVLKDQTALRNTGKRITATTKQVAELCTAYENGFISPKTLANTLRLMREEVSNDWHFKDDTFIDRLRRNVQIGAIKQGIRLATVARKCERVMEIAHLLQPTGVRIDTNESTVTEEYSFFDKHTDSSIVAGMVITDTADDDRKYVAVSKYSSEEVDHISPELLHARSDLRCKRLGKPHINE